MCFTGGFALAMMVDPAVAAPVVAQPSVPFAVGRKRAADLNLSPADLAAVKQRAAAGCEVLGLRYRDDSATGTRFDTLTREIGDPFIRVEFEGKGHSTLTAPPAGGRRPGAGVPRREAARLSRLTAGPTPPAGTGTPTPARYGHSAPRPAAGLPS